MCTGQKIRVMLNEAYTTASPLSFTSPVPNKLQSWLRNVESFKKSIRNSRFKRKKKKKNIIIIFKILLHIYISGSSRM